MTHENMPIRPRAGVPDRTTRLQFETLEERRVPAGFIAVGTDVGVLAQVRIFADRDNNDTYETLADTFLPFGQFTGGVRLALGDFDNDGNDELVTGAGPGKSRVSVWDLNSDGTVAGLAESFIAFPGFAGGVFVAAGNIGDDNRDELVVGTDSGVQARFKVYSDTDRDGFLSDNLTDELTPFGGFTGGVRVALGNTKTSSGIEELICARGPGGQPQVKVYSDTNLNAQVSDNPVVESFLAYSSTFTGGVNVAAGAIQGVNNTGAELITAPGSGAGRVRIYSDSDANGVVSDNPLFDSFFAYGSGFSGGVRLAAGDTDNTATGDGITGGFVEIVTGPGPGRAPTVSIRDDDGDVGVLVSDNPATQSFAGFDGNYTAGVFLAFGKVQVGTSAVQIQALINDDATLTSRIQVPPGAGVIRDLDVSLALSHDNNSDLDITLTHAASGISVVLFTDVSGARRGFIVRLDDAFPSDIGAVSAAGTDAVAGGFNLEDAALLSAFNGLDASGEWRLSILDDTSNGDNGLLISWSLHFTY